MVNDLALARTVLDTRAGFDIVGTFLNGRLGTEDIAERDSLRRHLNAGLRARMAEPLAALTATATREAVEVSRRCSENVDPVPMLEQLCSGIAAAYFFGEEGDAVHEVVVDLLDALSAVFGNPFALPPG